MLHRRCTSLAVAHHPLQVPSRDGPAARTVVAACDPSTIMSTKIGDASFARFWVRTMVRTDLAVRVLSNHDEQNHGSSCTHHTASARTFLRATPLSAHSGLGIQPTHESRRLRSRRSGCTVNSLFTKRPPTLFLNRALNDNVTPNSQNSPNKCFILWGDIDAWGS